MTKRYRKKPINDRLLNALIDFFIGFLLIIIDHLID